MDNFNLVLAGTDVSDVKYEQSRNHLKNVLQNLEVTFSVKGKRFLDKVQALLGAWELITTLFASSSTNYLQFEFEHLLEFTLNFVLSADWNRRSNPATKTHLTVTLQRFCLTLTNIRKYKNIIDQCNTLKQAVENQWGNLVLKKLTNNENVENEDFFEFFKQETGKSIIVRVNLLLQSKWDVVALRLCKALIDCKEKYPSAFRLYTPEQFDYLTDVYFSTVYKLYKKEGLILIIKDLSFDNVLKLVQRYNQFGGLGVQYQKKNSGIRIWKKSRKIIELIFSTVLVKAMTENVTLEPSLLDDLITEWNLFYSTASHTCPLLPPDIMSKLVCLAERSERIYPFCRFIVQHHDYMKKHSSEMLRIVMRAVSLNVNELEQLKPTKDVKKLKEACENLSSGFLMIGSLFSECVNINKECLLSSFSVLPTKDGLEKLEKFVASITYNQEHNLIKKLGQDTSGQQSPFTFPDELLLEQSSDHSFSADEELNKVDYDLLKEKTVTPRIIHSYEAEIEKLNLDVVSQGYLRNILKYNRLKTLNWNIKWNKLKVNCKNYLDNFEKKSFTDVELKYLNIDYNQFRNRQPDNQDTDIEKGYEECLGSLSNNNLPVVEASNSKNVQIQNELDFLDSEILKIQTEINPRQDVLNMPVIRAEEMADTSFHNYCVPTDNNDNLYELFQWQQSESTNTDNFISKSNNINVNNPSSVEECNNHENDHNISQLFSEINAMDFQNDTNFSYNLGDEIDITSSNDISQIISASSFASDIENDGKNNHLVSNSFDAAPQNQIKLLNLPPGTCIVDDRVVPVSSLDTSVFQSTLTVPVEYVPANCQVIPSTMCIASNNNTITNNGFVFDDTTTPSADHLQKKNECKMPGMVLSHAPEIESAKFQFRPDISNINSLNFVKEFSSSGPSFPAFKERQMAASYPVDPNILITDFSKFTNISTDSYCTDSPQFVNADVKRTTLSKDSVNNNAVSNNCLRNANFPQFVNADNETALAKPIGSINNNAVSSRLRNALLSKPKNTHLRNSDKNMQGKYSNICSVSQSSTSVSKADLRQPTSLSKLNNTTGVLPYQFHAPLNEDGIKCLNDKILATHKEKDSDSQTITLFSDMYHQMSADLLNNNHIQKFSPTNAFPNYVPVIVNSNESILETNHTTTTGNEYGSKNNDSETEVRLPSKIAIPTVFPVQKEINNKMISYKQLAGKHPKISKSAVSISDYHNEVIEKHKSFEMKQYVGTYASVPTLQTEESNNIVSKASVRILNDDELEFIDIIKQTETWAFKDFKNRAYGDLQTQNMISFDGEWNILWNKSVNKHAANLLETKNTVTDSDSGNLFQTLIQNHSRQTKLMSNLSDTEFDTNLSSYQFQSMFKMILSILNDVKSNLSSGIFIMNASKLSPYGNSLIRDLLRIVGYDLNTLDLITRSRFVQNFEEKLFIYGTNLNCKIQKKIKLNISNDGINSKNDQEVAVHMFTEYTKTMKAIKFCMYKIFKNSLNASSKQNDFKNDSLYANSQYSFAESTPFCHEIQTSKLLIDCIVSNNKKLKINDIKNSIEEIHNSLVNCVKVISCKNNEKVNSNSFVVNGPIHLENETSCRIRKCSNSQMKEDTTFANSMNQNDVSTLMTENWNPSLVTSSNEHCMDTVQKDVQIEGRENNTVVYISIPDEEFSEDTYGSHLLNCLEGGASMNQAKKLSLEEYTQILMMREITDSVAREMREIDMVTNCSQFSLADGIIDHTAMKEKIPVTNCDRVLVTDTVNLTTPKQLEEEMPDRTATKQQEERSGTRLDSKYEAKFVPPTVPNMIPDSCAKKGRAPRKPRKRKCESDEQRLNVPQSAKRIQNEKIMVNPSSIVSPVNLNSSQYGLSTNNTSTTMNDYLSVDSRQSRIAATLPKTITGQQKQKALNMNNYSSDVDAISRTVLARNAVYQVTPARANMTVEPWNSGISSMKNSMTNFVTESYTVNASGVVRQTTTTAERAKPSFGSRQQEASSRNDCAEEINLMPHTVINTTMANTTMESGNQRISSINHRMKNVKTTPYAVNTYSPYRQTSTTTGNTTLGPRQRGTSSEKSCTADTNSLLSTVKAPLIYQNTATTTMANKTGQQWKQGVSSTNDYVGNVRAVPYVVNVHGAVRQIASTAKTNSMPHTVNSRNTIYPNKFTATMTNTIEEPRKPGVLVTNDRVVDGVPHAVNAYVTVRRPAISAVNAKTVAQPHKAGALNKNDRMPDFRTISQIVNVCSTLTPISNAPKKPRAPRKRKPKVGNANALTSVATCSGSFDSRNTPTPITTTGSRTVKSVTTQNTVTSSTSSQTRDSCPEKEFEAARKLAEKLADERWFKFINSVKKESE